MKEGIVIKLLSNNRYAVMTEFSKVILETFETETDAINWCNYLHLKLA